MAEAESTGLRAEEVAVCAFSGQPRPLSLMVKYGDRWVAIEHKEAFLQSLREGAPVARMAGVGEMQYVGFWWRVLGAILVGASLAAAGDRDTAPAARTASARPIRFQDQVIMYAPDAPLRCRGILARLWNLARGARSARMLDRCVISVVLSTRDQQTFR